jgi:hypothetical protein
MSDLNQRRTQDGDPLSKLLRQQALAHRPPHDPARHQRIMAALARESTTSQSDRPWNLRRYGAMAAGLFLAAAVVAVWIARPGSAGRTELVIEAPVRPGSLVELVEDVNQQVGDLPVLTETSRVIQIWAGAEQDSAIALDLIDRFAVRLALASDE